MSINYQYGQLVRLKGLNNATYNSKLARIELFPSNKNVSCNGRYRIQLMDEVTLSLGQFVNVKPENLDHACTHCHKSGEKLMFCAKCKNAMYCDRECQRIDWEKHKKDCTCCSVQRDMTRNPLLPAIAGNDLRLVQKLVEEDRIDVNMTSNATNASALHAAAALGHLSIVQYLLQRGAEIHNTDNDGNAALYYAAQNGHLSVRCGQRQGRQHWL